MTKPTDPLVEQRHRALAEEMYRLSFTWASREQMAEAVARFDNDRTAMLVEALENPTPEMWEAAWDASQDYFVADAISKRGLEAALKAFVASAALRTQEAHGG